MNRTKRLLIPSFVLIAISAGLIVIVLVYNDRMNVDVDYPPGTACSDLPLYNTAIHQGYVVETPVGEIPIGDYLQFYKLTQHTPVFYGNTNFRYPNITQYAIGFYAFPLQNDVQVIYLCPSA